MKKILLSSIFAMLLACSGAHVAQASSGTTVICYNACTPTFSNHVGTVVLDLQCNHSSPVSYTGSLTVNGVGLSYVKNCNRPPIGNHETASCTASGVAVRGWAFDPDSSGTSISMHFYEGGSYLGACSANQSRADVNTAYGITGNHGFNCTLPAMLAGNHNITAYAIDTAGGTNPVISNSPRTVTCPAVVVNGSCGTKNTTYPAATTDYPAGSTWCTAGTQTATPAFPAPGSSASWNCAGSGGGTTAGCTVQVALPVINGSCGTKNTTYPAATTDYPAGSTWCTAGTQTATPAFPASGSSASWNCAGSGGGTAASCVVQHTLPLTVVLPDKGPIQVGVETRLIATPYDGLAPHRPYTWTGEPFSTPRVTTVPYVDVTFFRIGSFEIEVTVEDFLHQTASDKGIVTVGDLRDPQ